MNDIDTVLNTITEACDIYEKSSPVVYNYLNDLYIRINEKPDSVILTELYYVMRLKGDNWLHANMAQNSLYHLMTRLQRDTTGMSDF